MDSDKSTTSPALRIASALLVVGVVAASFLPALDALQKPNSNSAQTLIEAQLSKVPVFTVTDKTGRPFLSETEDHRLRKGYFFVQPADAEKYLEKVQMENTDAKVLAIGLDEAVKFLGTKPTPAKSIPESFELFPDDHEAELANLLTEGAFQKQFGKRGVPIFYIDGLAVKDEKQDTSVYPLFFEKEKLDEMVQSVKKKDPKTSLDVKDLQIIDLQQTIKEIQSGGSEQLNRIVFVPLSESISKLKAVDAS